MNVVRTGISQLPRREEIGTACKSPVIRRVSTINVKIIIIYNHIIINRKNGCTRPTLLYEFIFLNDRAKKRTFIDRI